MIFNIEISTALYALKSLESWLNIKSKDILKFVSKQKYIYHAQDFIDYFSIEDTVILRGHLNIVSLHVTTNNDNCESIKEYGLINLQDVIKYNTTLGNYLREQDIEIDLNEKVIKYKGKLFSIKKKDENTFPGSKGRYKNNVILKLYEDYQITGFICCNNALRYIGGVCYRPEFLYNLSVMLENKEIVDNWLKRNNKCYVLKYILDISEFEHYTFDVKVINAKDYEENIEKYELVKRKWLIVNALSVILNSINISEVYSYTRFNTKIPIENIEILTDQEYIIKYNIKN